MIRGPVCISILALLVCSCDKGRELLLGATAKVEGSSEFNLGGPVDLDLETEVQRTDEGVRFRKDLPFPRELIVKIKVENTYVDVRSVRNSAMGVETNIITGRTEEEMTYTKTPGTFALRIDNKRFVPKITVEGKVQDGEPTVMPDFKPMEIKFSLSQKGWRPRNDGGPVDFKKAVWADSMKNDISVHMVEAGVHPRTQWFSSRTWQVGDSIVLTGNALKLLDANDVSGRMSLVFQGEEAVGGHPCGVFSCSGEIAIRGYVSPEGDRFDAEITVLSGKIWASLLYPLILREVSDSVHSRGSSPGSAAGQSFQMQGQVKSVQTLAWDPQ